VKARRTEKLPGGKFFMENYAAQKYDNPPEATALSLLPPWT